MRKTWYEVKAAAGDAPAVISIYDEIGGWGVSAKDFITSLDAIKAGAKSISLNINSPGGSVFDALTMFNALKKCGATVNVCVMGIAASSASYIAMAGDTITMPENTFMMIHNPLNAIYGNAADMREMADVLDKIGNSLTATYVARTGLSETEVRDLLANDTYLTAAECVELGFADEMIAAVTAKASFEREHLPEHIQALFKPVDAVETELVESKPAAPAPVPFADQVKALAVAAGIEELAPALALDTALDTLEKVSARIAEVREITSLCTVAKCPDTASELIAKGVPLADCRSTLCELLAKSDDTTGVDTTQSTKPVVNARPTAGIISSKVWAKRNSLYRS